MFASYLAAAPRYAITRRTAIRHEHTGNTVAKPEIPCLFIRAIPLLPLRNPRRLTPGRYQISPKCVLAMAGNTMPLCLMTASTILPQSFTASSASAEISWPDNRLLP